MNKVAVDVRSSEFCDIGHKTETCNRNVLCILMYLLCIMYSLLSRPTNAQLIYIYIYIYINNISHYVSNPTCFNASASSLGSLILLFPKLTK